MHLLVYVGLPFITPIFLIANAALDLDLKVVLVQCYFLNILLG